MTICLVRFPRHRAAASLKRHPRGCRASVARAFSAASGRGLIEAAAAPRFQGRSTGFPRHRAAASLKRRRGLRRTADCQGGFPRHRAAASLKRRRPGERSHPIAAFSAASGRGLIEARHPATHPATPPCFPRHRAAASLKPGRRHAYDFTYLAFSAASGRGLIEAPSSALPSRGGQRFSAASGRGLIEAPRAARGRG